MTGGALRRPKKSWEILGGDDSTEEIHITILQRATLSPGRVDSLFQEAGELPPKETEYFFTGMDAYPYSMLNEHSLQQWPRISNGNLTMTQEQLSLYPWAKCRLVRQRCLGSHKQASAIFKHVAFDDTECGDCIINALLRASGPVGLSAFLPPYERIYPSSNAQNPPIAVPEGAPVYLPLTKNWQTTDFTLHNCLQARSPVRVREWVLRTMARYKYVVGDTPHEFLQMTSSRQTKMALGRIRPDVALLAVNDDIAASPHLVGPILTRWMANRWNISAKWES